MWWIKLVTPFLHVGKRSAKDSESWSSLVVSRLCPTNRTGDFCCPESGPWYLDKRRLPSWRNNMTFKSGFVTIFKDVPMLGSQLLNSTLWEQNCHHSDKERQRTIRLWGVYTTDKEQIVFIVPQGFGKTALGDFMVESAYSTLREWMVLFYGASRWTPRGRAMTWLSNASRLLRCRLFLWSIRSTRLHPDQLLAQIDGP